jgi:hypothetical protein
MSAGAVCLSLVNACLASGWGAGWLTGWRARHEGFCDRGLALAPAGIRGGLHSHRQRDGARRPNAPARTWTRSRPGSNMILGDFLKALGQITDSRFIGVLASASA